MKLLLFFGLYDSSSLPQQAEFLLIDGDLVSKVLNLLLLSLVVQAERLRYPLLVRNLLQGPVDLGLQPTLGLLQVVYLRLVFLLVLS